MDYETGDARLTSAPIGGHLSVCWVTIRCMEVTARAIERILGGISMCHETSSLRGSNWWSTSGKLIPVTGTSQV
jgi:hypothetical protein